MNVKTFMAKQLKKLFRRIWTRSNSFTTPLIHSLRVSTGSQTEELGVKSQNAEEERVKISVGCQRVRQLPTNRKDAKASSLQTRQGMSETDGPSGQDASFWASFTAPRAASFATSICASLKGSTRAQTERPDSFFNISCICRF